MRDMLALVHQFYGDPNFHVHDVKLTKLIDFEAIASRFWLNIRIYEPASKLIFTRPSTLPNVDIGL